MRLRFSVTAPPRLATPPKMGSSVLFARNAPPPSPPLWFETTPPPARHTGTGSGRPRLRPSSRPALCQPDRQVLDKDVGRGSSPRPLPLPPRGSLSALGKHVASSHERFLSPSVTQATRSCHKTEQTRSSWQQPHRAPPRTSQSHGLRPRRTERLPPLPGWSTRGSA